MKIKDKTWIEISKNNILHNIKTLKSLAPNSKFMAVLKSNAYGHGLGGMNTICIQSGLVDWCGVDSLDEALLLRKEGNKAPILILGYVPFERIGECVENDISIVAYNKELLDYIKSLPTSLFQREEKKLKIHIKVETGTNRQGIEDEELLEFVKKASQSPHIIIEGIYTHFANIEDTTDPNYAMAQLKKFNESTKMLDDYFVNNPSQPPLTLRGGERWSNGIIKHAACSAALINYPETHFDMVRAGCALYGYWPSQETRALAMEKHKELELRPALTWKTKIVQIKNIKAGLPVGYGLTETVVRDSRVATLPVGYWDGYDRGLSSIGEVFIAGKKAKILGRICMNMCMADITDIPEAKLFDDIILLGGEIAIEEVAKKLGTINYEIITRINPLIKRIII